MSAAILLWSHALAALLFATLAITVAQEQAPRRRALALALAASAVAALATAGLGGHDVGASAAETLRDLAWLVAIAALLRRLRAGRAGLATIGAVVGAVALTSLAVRVLEALPIATAIAPRLFAVATVLRMTALAGALLVIHDALGAARAGRDHRAAGVAIGLVTMWGGELVLATLAWVAGSWTEPLLAARGSLALGAAVLMTAGFAQRHETPLLLSRTIAGRLVAALALTGYIGATAAASLYAGALAGEHAQLVRAAVVFGAGAGLLTLVSTPWLRAWLRVTLAKHFYGHRYDYRVEWQRFTKALGGGDPLGERIVRAMAGFTDSPAGLLLAAEDGDLVREADWRWSGAPTIVEARALAGLLATGWTVELDRVRDGSGAAAEIAAVPPALLADGDAWAVVPLIHDDTLVAAVVLARPPVDHRLDWEDFDLLRTAGRQAASHLAEERARTALAEVRRFDEFNRRFAFIMHDLKNLASQMALTASNARRHAENPAFRADMVATLGDCAERMTALIGRLSNHGDQPAEPLVAVDADATARRVAARIGHHPVEVAGHAACVLAHPMRLEQVLTQLVQNAVEASRPGSVVLVMTADAADRVAIDVVDRGVGMSAAFVRDQLFRPFASSKPGGFGLGAFEARQLVAAMGGTLAVESREGKGTRFRMLLPAASALEAAA